MQIITNYKIFPLLDSKYFISMNQKSNLKIIELIDQQTGKKQPYLLQLNQLGKGFYGTVFKAVHKYNPNLVFAVKVIKLQNKQSKHEILKQLQIIQRIPRSPNLVDTHKQHLQSQKNLYIFQEYCEGGSLSDYRQRNLGRLMREGEIYDLFYQLGKGYIDMHRAGIIHQDIKPSNILVKGRLYKYCDFGVSQLASNVKHTTSRKGTVSYMPPQKLKQKFLPNPKSDIYSLGVTIYEVIFGFHPYLQKKTKNIKQYLAYLSQSKLRPIHQLLIRVYNPTLAFNNFYDILQRMIALKADARIGIEQFIQIIENHQLFKQMRIPIQNDSPILKRYKNSNNSNKNQQQEHCNIAHSTIFIRKGQGQNRLLNQQVELEFQNQQNKIAEKQQQIRITKLKLEQQQKMFFNLTAEHKIIQTVIAYLNQGFKNFKPVFQDIEKHPFCGNTFFKSLQFFKEIRLADLLGLLIMKFNVILMKNFSDSVQNFQKFYQQSSLTQQVQFLQAEYTKFLVKINLENEQSRKSILNLVRNSNASQYIQLLSIEFSQLFKHLVESNSIRINFKKDLLNGIFLLYVNQVLKSLHKFDFLVQSGSSNISQVLQSQQMQRLDCIVKSFNIYRTLRIQDLKNQFYKQFEKINDMIYDFQQDSGEFVNISDYIDEQFSQQQCQDNQEEKGRKQKNTQIILEDLLGI